MSDIVHKVYHHPTRDLAIVHLDHEDKFVKDFEMLSLHTKLELSPHENFGLPALSVS